MIKKIRYALETALVYAVYGFFALLPVEMASNIGGGILRALGPRLRISNTARANIRAVFPTADAEKILDGMWDNIGRTAAEYSHLKEITHHRVEIVGMENLIPGAIFFSGHLGNWEIGIAAAVKGGFPMHMVYRRPNNAGVSGLLENARLEAGAAGMIAKGSSGAKEIFGALRRGHAVGMLMDQRLSEGISVPFFGRDAMTSTAPAVFARRLNCPLVPTRMERLEGVRFRITLFPPVYVGEEDDDLSVMRRVNEFLEGCITARPEQWLWLHRRWA